MTSLYQCFAAKVQGDRIRCPGKIDISIRPLIRGNPLELAQCMGCDHLDYMGEPVKKEDRGW